MSGSSSGAPGGRYGQVLQAVMAHKQECLQYMTLDSDTYITWRTLARNLNISTDCDLATFLLKQWVQEKALTFPVYSKNVQLKKLFLTTLMKM